MAHSPQGLAHVCLLFSDLSFQVHTRRRAGQRFPNILGTSQSHQKNSPTLETMFRANSPTAWPALPSRCSELCNASLSPHAPRPEPLSGIAAATSQFPWARNTNSNTHTFTSRNIQDQATGLLILSLTMPDKASKRPLCRLDLTTPTCSMVCSDMLI